jgi:hypothetical protein
MSESSSKFQENDDTQMTKTYSITEYLRMIVKDLNRLEKDSDITYTTEIPIYQRDYIAKIIIKESSSVIRKSGDTVITVDAHLIEKHFGIFRLKRHAHRLHLVVKTNLDKIPGVRMETVRALFKLYVHKLIVDLRSTEVKDADSKVEFTFT